MSWINSNATYKQNSKNELSFYHGFSKTPVEPNTSNGSAVTTLANATTKSGHTVLGSEVWASEIPWFGLVPSKAVAVTRLSGITKKNDLVRVNGDQDYIYIGEGDEAFTEATWSTYWRPITLTNGMVLKNAADEDVLRYYEKQQMQALEPNNNAGIDSNGYATRLFVNEDTHTAVTTVGQGSVVSQFVAGTDNIKNGIASSELNPVLYLEATQKIAGTHYYDYNVSGTILWNANVKSATPKITCFRYIGKTVSAKTAEIEKTISDLTIAAGAGIGVTDGTNSASGVTTLKVSGSNGIQTSVNTTSGEVTITPNTNVIATKASVDAITNNISSDKSSIATNSSKLITGGAIYAAIEDAKEDAAITVNGKQHKTLTFENGTATTATVGQDDGKIKINVSTGEVVSTNTTLPVTGAKVQEYVSSNAIAPSATVTGSGSDSDNTYVGATVALSGSLTAPTVGVTIDESKLTAKLSAIDASIKSISDVGVSYEIVTALPTENIVSGRIYLVPSTIVEGTYDEYIRANDKWEKIGTTAADLTGYIQEVKVNGTALSETSGSVNIPAASTSAYGVTKLYNATGTATDGAITQGAVNTALETKLDTATFTAHETAMNTEIGKKANSADVYTKTDANTTFLSKTDASSTYVSKTDAASYAKSITLNNSTSKATVDETGNINLPTVVTSVNESSSSSAVYGYIGADGHLTLGVRVAPTTGGQCGIVEVYNQITAAGQHDDAVPTIEATYNFVSSTYTQLANGVYSKTAINQLLSGKADASSVITGATMNGESVSVSNGVLSLGNVITGVSEDHHLWDGTGENLSTSAIYTHIASDGTMTQAIAFASEISEGIVKLRKNYIGGNMTGDTYKEIAASVHSVSEAYKLLANDIQTRAKADEVVSAVNDVRGNVIITNVIDNTSGPESVTSALSGHSTKTEGGVIYLYDGYVNGNYYLRQASLPSNCIRVENNFMYDSNNFVVGQIKPERFISGFYANKASNLTSWVGDMPNLINGCNSGAGIFDDKSSLTTFIGDLSSLTDGSRMFYCCTALTTFIGDLSSLTNGSGMFAGTQLTVESVEIIADTLPEITNSGQISIQLQTPPSSTTELTAYMTAMTPIVDKGWYLYTNTQIADLFDTTKYTVSGNTVQKK